MTQWLFTLAVVTSTGLFFAGLVFMSDERPRDVFKSVWVGLTFALCWPLAVGLTVVGGGVCAVVACVYFVAMMPVWCLQAIRGKAVVK